MKKLLSVVLMALASVLSLPSQGFAALVDLDGVGGNSPYNVATLDTLPGNTYLEDLGDVDVLGIDVPTRITSWARLGQVLDSLSQVIAVPGLNTGFQITNVIEFDALATKAGGSVVYTLDQNAVDPGTFKLFWNGALTADDLAGTGFQDGTLIYEGEITVANGAFVKIGQSTSLLDAFGPDDHSGILTHYFVGGGALTATTQYYHPDFFVGGAPGTIVFEWNTSLVAPFNQTNPSLTRLGLEPIMIGPINGKEPNLLLQSDANASLQGDRQQIIPEPMTASLSIMSASSLALICLRRRRQR